MLQMSPHNMEKEEYLSEYSEPLVTTTAFVPKNAAIKMNLPRNLLL